jgi:hypothetical protein
VRAIAAHGLAVAPAVLAATWIYRHALRTFFTPDDLVSLSRAAALDHTTLVFRPLSAGVAYRLQYGIFGLNPLGYHAVNLALHLAAVLGVYALAVRLTGKRGVGAASALLFAASGIAFTPLHWVSGIGDLLACVLLLGATMAHLEGRRRGLTALCWAAAVLAASATLAKETAITWPAAIAMLEWRSGLFRPRWRALLPSVAAGLGMGTWLAFTRHVPGSDALDPYGIAVSPVHLAVNLLTYAGWCAALWDPLRDSIAAVDSGAWRVGLVVALGTVVAVRHQWPRPRHPLEVGVAWWCVFLVPVLPLAHHTYLYYLYIPWAGGAVAVAVGTAGALERLPPRVAAWIGCAGLAGFGLVEGHDVAVREHATVQALPVDRTLREAALLGHALPALRASRLAPGTSIGFVNPVPGPRFDLVSGSPARAEDRAVRTSYLPLEAVLRGGEALRLFAPGLVYRGFATTIPPGWEDVECFLYEQRGWLRPWGRGQDALRNQAALQASKGRWAEAESSFVRVRALGDTLPQAVCGEAVALYRLHRNREADALVDTFERRWPHDRRTTELRRARDPAATVSDLIPAFDSLITRGSE